MAEDILLGKLNRLVYQDANIHITKQKAGEDMQIDAIIEGNPIAAAYAIFQAINDNEHLLLWLRFFMDQKK